MVKRAPHTRASRYRAIATAARSAQVLAQEALANAEELHNEDPHGEGERDRRMRRQLEGDVFSLRTTHDLALEMAAELAASGPPRAINPPKHRRRA